MQLKSILLLWVIGLPRVLWSQDISDITDGKLDRSWFKKGAFTETEINILSSYYDQDGNHSPVTGGTGTEQLTDFTPTIIVNVPLDSAKQLSINFGIDFYSSASTDNIDDVSSTSSSDSREHVDFSYTQRLPYRRETFTVSGGLSSEYDVNSVSFGGSWTKESKDGNRELSFNGKAFLDKWKIYSPDEFRSQGVGDGQQSDSRNSYAFGIGYGQILSKRLQASISGEIVYQDGMLSTPFHRVFFNDGVDVSGLTERQLINSSKLRRVENLPGTRVKLPFGIRLNYYASDFIVLRSHYRFYWDDFGIVGNTFDLEAPLKITPFFSVIPFYRYHTQTTADYFKPFGEHLDGETTYFTSDNDLAGLNSHKAGIGIRYSPVYGVGRFKFPGFKDGTLVNFKGIDLRFAKYHRSDGLDAWIASFDLSFGIK